MRDPVTLVVVAREAASLHTQLLATLHTALPRIGVLDPGIFACDLAGTEELLGAPSRVARRVLTRCARLGTRASAGIAPTFAWSGVPPFVIEVAAAATPTTVVWTATTSNFTATRFSWASSPHFSSPIRH